MLMLARAVCIVCISEEWTTTTH